MKSGTDHIYHPQTTRCMTCSSWCGMRETRSSSNRCSQSRRCVWCVFTTYTLYNDVNARCSFIFTRRHPQSTNSRAIHHVQCSCDEARVGSEARSERTQRRCRRTDQTSIQTPSTSPEVPDVPRAAALSEVRAKSA